MCILHDIKTQNNQFSIYLLETWNYVRSQLILVSFFKNENHFTFKEEKKINDDDE
jgi:hypothetical protein